MEEEVLLLEENVSEAKRVSTMVNDGWIIYLFYNKTIEFSYVINIIFYIIF